MIKIGILGAAGYTGGELIRLLLNHPEAEIVFANSESNASNSVADVHEGLYGETDLKFTAEMPFDQVDVIFFCFGHGKSEAFLKEHNVPEKVKIIDKTFVLLLKLWLQLSNQLQQPTTSYMVFRK